jgi:hypothetical protein
MIRMRLRSELRIRSLSVSVKYRFSSSHLSFVADTLKLVGKDMKSKEVDEDDVEDAVSLRFAPVGCTS